MKLGWIGVGSIGAQMVLRALGAGHEVLAYARGAGLETVTAAGARATRDYAEVGAFSDMLGVCVFSDGQVRESLIGGGALATMRPGSVLANHTTGSPELARELASAAPAGVEVLDATFSGGAGAQLTLMIGGTEAGVERARPVLETYANALHLVGPAGRGQSLKLLNNLLFCANMRLAAAAMELAADQGFDVAAAANILKTCSGQSFALDRIGDVGSAQRMIEAVRPYMKKDARAARIVAEGMGLDMTPFADSIRHFGGDE